MKLRSLLVVLACAKPGDDCTDTPGSCKDKASHLVCVNKKYILETCKGQNGCNDEGKTLICDSSKADVGDGCGIEGSRELEAICIVWVKIGGARSAWDHGFRLLVG